jgi:hypothetical protein
MLTPKAFLGLTLLVLESFGASHISHYSRLFLAPYFKTPRYSLPFSFASDVRTEALADRKNVADMTKDYQLYASAPCGHAVHVMLKLVQEQGRRLELRGGCSAENVELVNAG